MVLSEPELTEARTVFSNHAFFWYLNESSNFTVLDACVGPATGDLDLHAYIHKTDAEEASQQFYKKPPWDLETLECY